ncbi:hypothetical protein HA152_07375 [Prochlorococcus marinus XMU1412]|uniref:hypothetical protein n=1 Tax=Prochlorococcus marinus TaxID=1219 RepID=UPI001ADBB554|nr:hypothetical protein [Prochlorococcus marinus]MBO8240522.1 hypothetical protein [Prochlorococcus marinus XMU1412]MBW3071756.1 hypothetical protein [Prochlorococcus marinus str. MU1412]
MKLDLIKSIKLIFIFFLIITSKYFFSSINVKKDLSEEDIRAIKMLNVDKQCKKISDYKSEIECIKTIQIAQKNLVNSEKCRTGLIDVEPINFINYNFGCCYDRARFIEKTLTYYGFESRRIFLLATDKYGIFSAIVPKQDSHAVSEAKTSKGWIGVETIEPFFVLNDEDNNPLTFRKALKEKYNFPKKIYDNFYYRNPMSINGLYSRHGKFHNPYIPLPEINFKDFAYNFNILNLILVNK